MIYTADFLDIPPMIKDLLGRLCQDIPFKSGHELETLFSIIPVPEYANALLYCMNENSSVEWSLKPNALSNREEFRVQCDLRPGFDVNRLDWIPADIKCLNYIQNNHVYLVTPSTFTVDLQNVDASVQINKDMGFKIKFHGVCKSMLSKTAHELETLLSMIDVPEYKNALLFCVNENPPQDWSLGDAALEKREAFRVQCNLKPGFDLTEMLWVVLNPNVECLQFIKENHFSLLTGRYFYLNYDNLGDFSASAYLLNNMDMRIKLELKQWNVDMSLLAEGLSKVPTLNTLVINGRQQILDLALIPDMLKLQILIIKHCQLTHLPEFLEKNFPEMIELSLVLNHMTKIGKIKFPKIQKLYLCYNQLTDVSELLQSQLTELVELNLRDNQILAIGKIDKRKMPNLEPDGLLVDANVVNPNIGPSEGESNIDSAEPTSCVSKCNIL
jgi:hypothetical protein